MTPQEKAYKLQLHYLELGYGNNRKLAIISQELIIEKLKEHGIVSEFENEVLKSLENKE